MIVPFKSGVLGGSVCIVLLGGGSRREKCGEILNHSSQRFNTRLGKQHRLEADEFTTFSRLVGDQSVRRQLDIRISDN